MPGEMTSPAGKGDVNNSTLRPITVKQALDATQPYPEANFQIDGADVASIFFVGQVRNISSQTTNITYKVDDGTGEIEVKHWVDSTGIDSMDVTEDSSKSRGEPQIELNGYVKVFGKLKVFGNKRYVGAHCVRPLTDINELNCHFLHATAIHLFFTRGPPGASGAGPGAAAKVGDASMAGADDYGANSAGQVLSAMSANARRVFNLLKSEPQSNEGLHVQLMAAKLNLPVTAITQATLELHGASLIFSTIDDETWAILGY